MSLDSTLDEDQYSQQSALHLNLRWRAVTRSDS